MFKIVYIILLAFLVCSCESKEERLDRIKEEIELQKAEALLLKEKETLELRRKESEDRIAREEKERSEKEHQAAESLRRAEARERKRKQDELDRWKNNSLSTGATPWSDCYGSTNSCSFGCSQISVKTPRNSDVIVTLKQFGEVIRHAYINENSTYMFEIPNGTYQPFFYYGKGWNPNKTKKSGACGSLNGAFISGEDISKDKPQTLSQNILSYELILQENGNLQTKPSNEEEAF